MIIGGSQGAKIFDKNFHQVIFELSKKLNLKNYSSNKCKKH